MKVLVAFGILGLISISRQAPSSPPPTTENSQECPTNHTSPRTFPHPTSCHKYLQCANGTKLEMECPIGQQYNTILEVCDSPRFANCKLSQNESSTTIPSNIVTANGYNTTTVPSNIVPVQVSTESNGNTTKSEGTKDNNKSKEQVDVTTENSSGKPSEKNETATTKVETSLQETVDKDSPKQNSTSTTIPTNLNKRSNETAKGEATTPSIKEASSARSDINTTTPAAASVSTGQINVKDEAEPSTTEEDSSEKEEDQKTTEKSAEAKHDTSEKLGDTKSAEKNGEKSSSAESKPIPPTEGIKKEESTTAKSDVSKEVTKMNQTTTEVKDGKAKSRSMEPKEVTKADNNSSKEKAQPELGGEEERKKDDGKKPLEDQNKKVGA